MAKIVGIREQLGAWDASNVRWGWAALFAAGVGLALVAPRLVPNRRRRLRRNPRGYKTPHVRSPHQDEGDYRFYVFLTWSKKVGSGYGIDSGYVTREEAERAANRVRRIRPVEMQVHVFSRKHLKSVGFDPNYVRSWKRAPKRPAAMVANPELRVVVKSPLGKRLADYNVHAATLHEAFNRAEDEAERLGVRVSGAARTGNTYTIVGTTKAFARH